ncbi:hypothetical protein KGY73_07600 [bacterium]|nr:hypothetical protein [bacterium]
MVKENENTIITEKDLEFIRSELSQTNEPLSYQELTRKLAYRKTASQLQQEVKKYNPYCRYEVGDLIYKEYDEPLMVSSKVKEHFKGGVVVKVKRKIKYENFNSEMLEVDYSWGGTFRKHIDYMKKTGTHVLLPSNLDGKSLPPETLSKEEDPRHNVLPMSERDLKALGKNLKSSLTHSNEFLRWEDYIQLKEKEKEIPEEKIKEMEAHIQENKTSASTEELVSQFFNIKPSQESFNLYCISLNHVLKKDHKKNFIYVSPEGWGRWHLKNTLDSFLENLPLSAPPAKTPQFEKEAKPEAARNQRFPLKLYLTWREVLSGGLRIPRILKKKLSQSREYIFTYAETGKNYRVYFYPSKCFFIGLNDFYQENNIPQGASLTLERKDQTHFHFWVKKSKKKISFPKVTYNPDQDKFTAGGDELFTFAMPNKIIHLESEFLKKITSLYPQREQLDLRALLLLVFKNFGLQGENLSLHFRRAYHLVDMLKNTTLEEVEKTLLNSSEFGRSEKKKAVFFYKEKIKKEEEIKPEKEEEEEKPVPRAEVEKKEKGEERPAADTEQLEIGVIEGESPKEEIKAESPQPEVEEKPQPPEPSPEPKKEEITEKPKEKEIEKEKKPKKEKPPKKKKKPEKEGPKPPRRGKGEKRVIEEQIELEESEEEALYAVKSEEGGEEEKVVPPSQKKKKKEKKASKPYVSKEPSFGIFAEKLQSALKQKDPQKKEKKEPKTSSQGSQKEKESKNKNKSTSSKEEKNRDQ